MLKMERHIDIDRFDYDLPDERIAKYPLEERSASKLLVYERGEISERASATSATYCLRGPCWCSTIPR